VVWHLVRAIGRLRTTGILFSDTRLSAAEAHRLGLVTEVTGTGGARARALAIAEAIAATSRDTTLLTLRAIRRAEQTSHRDYLDAELELAALNLHGPDVAAARLSYKAAGASPAKGGR
jgi:enoyl-CoA hydratase/carnithine racemase